MKKRKRKRKRKKEEESYIDGLVSKEEKDLWEFRHSIYSKINNLNQDKETKDIFKYFVLSIEILEKKFQKLENLLKSNHTTSTEENNLEKRSVNKKTITLLKKYLINNPKVFKVIIFEKSISLDANSFKEFQEILLRNFPSQSEDKEYLSNLSNKEFETLISRNLRSTLNNFKHLYNSNKTIGSKWFKDLLEEFKNSGMTNKSGQIYINNISVINKLIHHFTKYKNFLSSSDSNFQEEFTKTVDFFIRECNYQNKFVMNPINPDIKVSKIQSPTNKKKITKINSNKSITSTSDIESDDNSDKTNKPKERSDNLKNAFKDLEQISGYKKKEESVKKSISKEKEKLKRKNKETTEVQPQKKHKK
ncbi:hypothetical protein ACTFIW_000393 [Dictyostelium discoideum]